MITKQITPFTELFVSSKNYIDKLSWWTSNEISKNESLPQLPIEIWRQIIINTIPEKRKDAIILGDKLVINTSHGGTCVGITPIKTFIWKYGQKKLETIQRKTFGSDNADAVMALQLYNKRTTIYKVLMMK